MRMSRFIPSLAALLGLVACQKAETNLPEESGSQAETYAIEFVSERPQTDDGTRTHWDGQTILWDQSDFIRMGYTVNGVWQNGSGNASEDAKLYGSQGTTLTEGGAVASFTTNVNFKGTTQGPHEFYAVFPGSATVSTMPAAPKASVTIPMTQTPLADSFDPTADLMLGHSIDPYDARPTTPVRLIWNRVVAHGQITLKNLPGTVSGETVSTITLTAQAGANLTGAQEIDITTGSYTPAADNTSGNQIIIKGDNLTLDSNGNVTFWMAILPEDLTGLVVRVQTDKATYTRSITSFSRTFIANRRNVLSINMASAVRVSDYPSHGDYYTLVTDNAALDEGHYLIAYVSGDKANVLSGIAGSSNTYGAYVGNIDVADDAIAYNDAGAYDVEVMKTANGYSLKLGDQYLGYTSSATSGSNYLSFNSTFASNKYEWTLAVDANGNATITNVYNTARVLQWNSASGQERFSCYTGTQKAVQLFKWTGSAVPKVTTRPATDITVSSAILNARFSNLGTTNVQNVHFLWGTKENELTETLEVGDDFDVASGEFHITLSSLDEGKTYYFKAVLQYCTDGANYLPLEGKVQTFKTLTSAIGGNAGLQWLGCYEIPSINLVNTNSYSGRGTETFGSTKWYNYKTTNAMQKVVTHTYAYNGKTYRNYTTMVDGEKRCPIWTAYVMHSGAYPDNHVERGSFNTNTSYDPGIAKSWQSSGSTSDYNNGNGYARGHHVASSDRKVNDDANDQTFYYTNQSPQWQNKFNDGVWSSLEGNIQSNAPSGRDTLYVVVGTLFENGNSGSSNDGGIVARPSHFYKLLMKCSFDTSGTMTNARGVAFLYTNEAHTGNYYDSSYRTTIREIETRANLNFFANVPTAFQDAAEQTSTLIC